MKYLKCLLLTGVLFSLVVLSCKEDSNPTSPSTTGTDTTGTDTTGTDTTSNTPPTQASAVFPTGGQQDIDTGFVLKWESTDADSDTIFYTVLLDTVSPPAAAIASDIVFDSVAVSGLKFGKTYYWRVSATDGRDTVLSPVSSFSIRELQWDEIIPDLRKTCYIIGFEFEGHVYGFGSGFAVSPNRIMTNAHVVTGLVGIIEQYGMEDIKMVAVRDGGQVNQQYSYELDSFAVHPEYDSSTNYTYDFALLTVKSGTIADTVVYESAENLLALKVGDEVATIGFPGETNSLNTVQPIATYKSGTISALRPFNPDLVQASPATNVVVQHNFNTTGGTSGSPVFNKNGKVIGIHNSGEYEFIYSDSGWTRIPVGSLGYSIRIDQRTSLQSTMRTAFADVEPNIVWYQFVNGTLSDMEMYVDGTLYDTIGWLDTLELWDYEGAPVNDIITLFTIVATNNWLYWSDTLVTGRDFYRRYYVSDNYFLLGLTNNTNKTMKSCVVSSGSLDYDSSLLYMPIGTYEDVGYYQSSSLTDIRLYFYSALDYIYWEDLDTWSTTDEAKYLPLQATLTLSKTVAGTVVTTPKHKEAGTKETYYRKDFLRSRQ